MACTFLNMISSPVVRESKPSDGAPRLSAEVGELLQLIETMKGTSNSRPRGAHRKMDSATLLSLRSC